MDEFAKWWDATAYPAAHVNPDYRFWAMQGWEEAKFQTEKAANAKAVLRAKDEATQGRQVVGVHYERGTDDCPP